MCTVTFLPTADGVLISSNRDEKIQRALAIPPMRYKVNGFDLVFPKDQDAAGTWIAIHEAGQIAVLLNGAFQKHEPTYPYKRSRGLVFLDIIASNNLDMAFKEIVLDNIEPFTVILYKPGTLTENIWDGKQKLSRQISANKPHIWSSVTLYDDAIIRKRVQWFQEWQLATANPDADSIQQFHMFAGNAGEYNKIRMIRNGEMLTVSITCIATSENEATMHYTDLQNEIKKEITIRYSHAPQLPA